jgi:dienelactone hydrolase
MSANANSASTSAAITGGVSAEQSVEFQTSDGWRIVGTLHIPSAETKTPGVVLVHGSRHEADAFGQIASPSLADTLSQHGLATLRIDIRGRGASREPRRFYSMSPEQRDGVLLDVEAAIEFLAETTGIKSNRIGVVGEQDTAGASLIAASTRKNVAACVLISGRLNRFAQEAFAETRKPIFCLVSKEDRRGLKDMVDVYLSSKNKHSRIKVFEGLALGTTMFSTWRYEYPSEIPIEDSIADWLSENLGTKSREKKQTRKTAN